MTWQPIETAPKDGTQILAYWPAPDYAPDAPCTCNTWRSQGTIDNWVTPYEESRPELGPTHWMPLPDAPEAE